jgi:hypothetical protein
MSTPSPGRARIAFLTADVAIPEIPRLPLYSVAVPPIQPGALAFAPEFAPEMSLRADRSCYRIRLHEAPAYSLTHAEPDQPIHWTMIRDGVLVVIDQVFDARTDGEGQWAGLGGAWQGGQEGFWQITARTGERKAQVQLLVTLDEEEVASTSPDEMLGVSHVAGHYRFSTPGSDLQPESFLVEGARHVLNLGARHVFVHLSPQYRLEYPFDDFGTLEPSSLSELAATRQFQDLFALDFETFVLTTYSFANWDWLAARGQFEPVTLDAAGEQAEIAALVRHLLATYPGKNFVIKNWEGDWQLKSSFEMDTEATEGQVAEFVDWLGARQLGVAEGRRSDDARARFAIEFNHVHAAQRGSRCMLTSVIPRVPSDLIAYSSWWTLAQPGDLARRIADDVAFVRHLPGVGGRPLVITEFGFVGKDPIRGAQTRTAVEAFAHAGIPLALYWQIFDNEKDIGLVGRGAQRLPAWHSLRSLTGAKNGASFDLEKCRIPPTLVARHSEPVHLVIRNEGLMFDPVVGYAVGLFDLAGGLLTMAWIREEVRTGETVEVDFVVRGPAQAGTYVFRMFQHGVELFGEELPIEAVEVD